MMKKELTKLGSKASIKVEDWNKDESVYVFCIYYTDSSSNRGDCFFLSYNTETDEFGYELCPDTEGLAKFYKERGLFSYSSNNFPDDEFVVLPLDAEYNSPLFEKHKMVMKEVYDEGIDDEYMIKLFKRLIVDNQL